MPHIASEVCPQCFKKFKLDIWLQKHISKEHPEHKQTIDVRKRQQRETPEDELPSKYPSLPPPRTIFQNHDPIYDGNTFADATTVFSHYDSASGSPSPLGPDDSGTTLVYPDSGLPCAYVAREDECNTFNTDPYYPFANEGRRVYGEMHSADWWL